MLRNGVGDRLWMDDWANMVLHMGWCKLVVVWWWCMLNVVAVLCVDWKYVCSGVLLKSLICILRVVFPEMQPWTLELLCLVGVNECCASFNGDIDNAT